MSHQRWLEKMRENLLFFFPYSIFCPVHNAFLSNVGIVGRTLR
jgi:hypothetical protein